MTNEEKEKAFFEIANNAEIKRIEVKGLIKTGQSPFVVGYVEALKDKDGDLVVEIHQLKERNRNQVNHLREADKKYIEQCELLNKRNAEFDDLYRKFENQSEVLKSYHEAAKNHDAEVTQAHTDRLIASQERDKAINDNNTLMGVIKELRKKVESLESNNPQSNWHNAALDLRGKLEQANEEIKSLKSGYLHGRLQSAKTEIAQLTEQINEAQAKILDLRTVNQQQRDDLIKYRNGQELTTESTKVTMTSNGIEINGVESVIVGGIKFKVVSHKNAPIGVALVDTSRVNPFHVRVEGEPGFVAWPANRCRCSVSPNEQK